MRFKPFTGKYHFQDDPLLKDYPEFLASPIADWLYRCLQYTQAIKDDPMYNKSYLQRSFKNSLQLLFRETVPDDWNSFLAWLFKDAERLTNFLALCLQNYAQEEHARTLEVILANGGSAYAVTKTTPSAGDYDRGVYNLTMRVPEVVQAMSAHALQASDVLAEAWSACYARNPDYEKTVSRCCDFIEGFLRDRYWPSEKKTKSIAVAVKEFRSVPNLLKYKGSSFVQDPEDLINLLSGVGDIRGQHTTGKGRKPTLEEAEYILHTVIYAWNLHQ